MFTLNDQQAHIVACALPVAAEVYEQDAKIAQACGDQRSADAFRRQAAAARALAEIME